MTPAMYKENGLKVVIWALSVIIAAFVGVLTIHSQLKVDFIQTMAPAFALVAEEAAAKAVMAHATGVRRHPGAVGRDEWNLILQRIDRMETKIEERIGRVQAKLEELVSNNL